MDFSKRNALASVEAKKLYTDEALKWNFPTFGKLTESPDKIVLLDKNNAIARYQLSAENGFIADVYFYMSKPDSWRIKSVRRLALTGLLEETQAGLKGKKVLTQEEKNILANIELTLGTDELLRDWLINNKTLMEQLIDVFTSSDVPKRQAIVADGPGFPKISALLKQLHINSMELQPDGNIEIVIGGLVDNTVGYIYSPENNPPKMDDDNYFWIEKVLDNWYLFRTT